MLFQCADTNRVSARASVRLISCNVVIVNLNVSNGTTYYHELDGPGCAITFYETAGRLIFGSVVSCRGTNMILNGGQKRPSLEWCNFIANDAYASILGVNYQGMIVKYCVFDQAAPPLNHQNMPGTQEKFDLYGCSVLWPTAYWIVHNSRDLPERKDTDLRNLRLAIVLRFELSTAVELTALRFADWNTVKVSNTRADANGYGFACSNRFEVSSGVGHGLT
jgi:hypothetical protein